MMLPITSALCPSYAANSRNGGEKGKGDPKEPGFQAPHVPVGSSLLHSNPFFNLPPSPIELWLWDGILGYVRKIMGCMTFK